MHFIAKNYVLVAKNRDRGVIDLWEMKMYVKRTGVENLAGGSTLNPLQ